jgi:outer membrane receptor for ferrienterochelin and colicins
LNWTNKGNPFIIRADPFDKNVQYDNNGNAQVTAEYGLTFDPGYVYGPIGIQAFWGALYVEVSFFKTYKSFKFFLDYK